MLWSTTPVPGACHWSMVISSGTSLKKLLFSSRHQLQRVPCLGLQSSIQFPVPVLLPYLCQSYARSHSPCYTILHQPFYIWKTRFPWSHPSFSFLFHKDTWPLIKTHHLDMVELFTVSHFLHTVYFWVFVLIPIFYKEKLFRYESSK